MKNKGFTLIELLGVFAFLGIAALIVIPSATGMLKQSKVEDSKRFENDLFLATEAYIESNSDHYDGIKVNGGVDYISIAELIDNGFISKNLVNPNTKNKINRNQSIKVTKNNDQFNYEIMDKDYSTNGYVTDGLILHYDGYKAPYSKNGNKYWRDLSDKHNDGLLVNTNNSIVYKQNSGYEFTNNADYIESINSLGLSTDPDVTFEFVYKFYGLQSNQPFNGIFTVGSTAATNGASFTATCTVPKCGFGTVNVWVESSEEISSNNTKYNTSFVKKKGTFNESNAFIYMNGVRKAASPHSSVDMNYLDTSIQIGRSWQWQGINRGLNGILYSVRVYNRTLSQSEITQNYNVDKIRFGI